MTNNLIDRQAAIDVLEERLQANGYSNVTLVSELNRSIGCLMQLAPVEAIPIEWLKTKTISELCELLENWEKENGK